MPFKIYKLRRKSFTLPPRNQVSEIQDNCGDFDCLPNEMLHLIFEYLSLSHIGQLALSSDAFKRKIMNWIWTLKCQNRATIEFNRLFMGPEPTYPGEPSLKSEILNVYLSTQPKLDEFGVLCKRLTSLDSTVDRIQFALTAFDHCIGRHCDQIDARILAKKMIPASKDWIEAIHLLQFMKMMNTFTKGWARSELNGLFRQLDRSFGISSDIVMITTTDPIFVPLEVELRLRMLLRSLTWDLAGDDYGDRANLIMATLKYFIGLDSEPRPQAIFFLTIFGLSCDDIATHYEKPNTLSHYKMNILDDLHNHTDWTSFTDMMPFDFRDGRKMFLVLAQAICCCLTHESEWKNNMLSPMLDEIFKIPGEWLRENVAAFLLFCNETLILHYIGDMILNGDEYEQEKAANLVHDMIIMSDRFDNELTSEKGVGKVFDKLCILASTSIQNQFYDQLWDTITKQVFSIDQENGEFDILEDFGSFLMKKAYKKLPVKLDNDDDENKMEIEE